MLHAHNGELVFGRSAMNIRDGYLLAENDKRDRGDASSLYGGPRNDAQIIDCSILNSHCRALVGFIDFTPQFRGGKAKLTEQLVRKIRKLKKTHREIAEKYGLAYATVRRARIGESWQHVK